MSRMSLFFAAFIPSILNAAISLGPERPVSPPSYEPPIGVQTPAVVASDGADFLVAWSDTSNVSAGLYVATVSRNGDVRPLPQQAVAVTGVTDLAGCWTGSEYLLVWNDGTVHAAVAATFARDGSLLSGPRRLADDIGRYSGGLACGSGSALMAYTTGDTIYGALIGEGGRLVQSGIGGWTVRTAGPAFRVASDGRDFALFLTWWTGGPSPETIYALARVRGSGEVIDSVPQPFASITGGGFFDVAYGGGRYALAITQHGVHIHRVLLDSVSLNATTFNRLVALNTFGISVLWNGSEFIAYWIPTEKPGRLRTLPFTDADVSALEPSIPVTEPDLALHPHLASNGQAILAVWMTGSFDPVSMGGGDIAGALLDRRGIETIVDPFLISLTAAMQTRPAIATSGSDSVVVWNERRPLLGGWQLRATRVTGDGRVLQQPLTIATNIDQSAPVVVYSGTTYLIFWSGENGSALFARSLGRDGVLGETVKLAGAARPYAAAAARESTLLAFATGGGTAAVRFTPNGELMDTTPIRLTDQHTNEVTVASNGEQFLVVSGHGSIYWQFPSPMLRDLLGVRVTAAGTVLDAVPLPLASTAADEAGAVVASNGGDYLLLFGQSGVDGWMAKRVSADGSSESAVPVTSLMMGWGGLALTAFEDGYLAAGQWNQGLTSEVRLARLDRSGAMIEVPADPAATTSVRASPLSMSPALTAAGGRPQLAYVRRASGPEYGDAARVFFRSDAVSAPPGRRRSIRP